IRPIAREPGQIAVKAQKTFEEAMENLQPMITAIKERLDAINQPADEVEVKFGVKLTSQVGAVLASVGGEVTYEITLKWNNKS
ncbi:MAG: CU044_2847 family protein, partial [Microcystaceae cyanobacterium]